MKQLLSLSLLAVSTCVPMLMAQDEIAISQSANLLKGTVGVRTPRLIPLRQVTFNKDVSSQGQASIAFDRDRVYLSTPDGFILAGCSLAADLRPVYQTTDSIQNQVYVYNHVLYVLTNLNEADRLDHAMLASRDNGRTFQPVDNGLQVCAGNSCAYLVATQLFAKDNLLYANAGGGANLQVSANGGATWTPLSGSLESMACYASPFEVAGRTVLQGGECPLDSAFLSRGALGSDSTSLSSPLTAARTPDLSNRRINGFAHQSGTSIVLSGAEGAILRSVDDGRTWKYALKTESGDGSYPYVPHFAFSSRASGFVLAGGFDKGGDRPLPFLAYSTRSGDGWYDLSTQLSDIVEGGVTDVKEDPYGRLIAVAVDSDAGTVTVYEVR